MSEERRSGGAPDVAATDNSGVFPTPAVAGALRTAITGDGDLSADPPYLTDAVRVFAVEARARGMLPEQALVSLKAIARVSPSGSTYQLRTGRSDVVDRAVRILIEEYFR